MSKDLEAKAKLFQAMIGLEGRRFMMTPDQRAKEHIRRFVDGEFTKRDPFDGIIFPKPKSGS